MKGIRAKYERCAGCFARKTTTGVEGYENEMFTLRTFSLALVNADVHIAFGRPKTDTFFSSFFCAVLTVSVFEKFFTNGLKSDKNVDGCGTLTHFTKI